MEIETVLAETGNGAELRRADDTARMDAVRPRWELSLYDRDAPMDFVGRNTM
jgi:hypothetical protein